MTKESFHAQIASLVDQLNEYTSVKTIADRLHLRPSHVYKYMRASSAPIWIARVAIIGVLRQMLADAREGKPV